jgi:hypothetical protein
MLFRAIAMGSKRDPKDDFLQIFKVDHSIFIHVMLGPCNEGAQPVIAWPKNISTSQLWPLEKKIRDTISNQECKHSCCEHLSPIPSSRRTHQVWSVECGTASFCGECMTEGLQCDITRDGVHAFNRESYYLLQTGMQVDVISVMGTHIKERNFIGLGNCNFRSPRSPHSFAQSTILIWLVHPHPLFGPLLVFNISNIGLIIPPFSPLHIKSEQ